MLASQSSEAAQSQNDHPLPTADAFVLRFRLLEDPDEILPAGRLEVALDKIAHRSDRASTSVVARPASERFDMPRTEGRPRGASPARARAISSVIRAFLFRVQRLDMADRAALASETQLRRFEQRDSRRTDSIRKAGPLRLGGAAGGATWLVVIVREN